MAAPGTALPGPRLENVVACALLKAIHFRHDRYGKQLALHYFRDREKREVDFVVTLNRRPLWCVEVKNSDSNLHAPLRYLHRRIRPKASFQLSSCAVFGIRSNKTAYASWIWKTG